MAEKSKRPRAATGTATGELHADSDVWQQYRHMAEAAGDVLFATDSAGLLTNISPAILHLTGFRPDELRGRPFAQLFPASWADYVHELEDGQRAVLPLRAQSSGEIYAELLLLHYEDGTLRGILRDVTERYRIERSLQESETRYRAIVEDQTELICRFRTDGTLTFVNDAFRRYYNQPLEALLDHSVFSLIVPEDQPVLREKIHKLSVQQPTLAHTQRALVGGEQRWQQWTLRAIYNLDHQVAEIQAVGRDIHARKEAEAQHRLDLIRYRALFERTNDAVFIIGLNGLHLAANQQAARMLGCQIDEIVGARIEDFVVPQDREQMRRVFQQLLNGDKIPVVERLFRRKNGDEFPAEINIAMVYDEKEQPLHAQSIVREITHRKQTEDVLQRALLQVETLYTVNQVLINAESLEDMLQAFASIAQDKERTGAALLYVQSDVQGKPEALELAAQIVPFNKQGEDIGTRYALGDNSMWSLPYNDGRITSIVDTESTLPNGSELLAQGLRARGLRAGVFIPLTSRRSQWVGLVVLAWPRPHQLSVYQQQLYTILAPQLATLVENRRLFEVTQAAMHSLAASEERLRMVLTNAPVVLVATDAEGRFTLVEGRSVEVLGLHPEQLIGQPLKVLSEAVPEVEQHFKRALKGESFTKTVETRGVALETRYSPLRTPEGRIAGVIGVATDVTERVRVERELNQRVEQLVALQQVEDEVSENLNIEYVLTMALDAAVRLSGSDTGFIGLLESDVLRVAESVGNYQRDSQLEPYKGIIGRVLRHQQPELVADVHADPDYVAFIPKTKAKIVIPLISHETVIGVLNLEANKPERFTPETLEFAKLLAARIAVAVDNARLYSRLETQVEELRQLYGQVKKLEQLKTDMIRIASHDLRNPLATIVGYLELLRWDKEEMTPDHRDYIESIGRATERMQKITSDILSLERIEETALEEQTESVDIADLVTRLIPEMNDQARKKAQQLSFDVPPHPLQVTGDSIQLTEAMTNLVNNAIKYTPPNGQIEVLLRRDGLSVIFEVKDTGIGIPEDQQGRLFEPFYRVRTVETKKIEGTGLGLHLVKNIVDRHNGRMIFSSVYGKGSTFGFSLPAKE
ncbi:MAG: PAS domain S-box protein [Chloroflexi bacterium]|nr:PAS domain S-box protein [Chloroflexota bacterium]